jgi:hypothetical protein
MITLKEYKIFNKFPTGSTQFEYNTKVAELFKWDINKLNEEELNNKVLSLKKQLVESKKEHKYLNLRGRWFKVDRDLYDLKHSQWIYFDQSMSKVYDEVKIKEDDTKEEKSKNAKIINDYLVENANKIIASFIRPCRIYKFFPKLFDINKAPIYSEWIDDLDIQIVFELTGFFFLYITRSMNNTRIEYSEKLEKEIWKKVKE